MTSLAPIEEARAHIAPVRGQRPRLSILVLSRADQFELERAMEVVGDAAWSLGAEVVLVREESTGSERDLIQRLVQKHQFQLAWVGAGSDRSAMTDEGLKFVTGDIVTCRDGDRIHDGEWLSAFKRFGAPSPRRVADVEVAAVPASDRGARVADRPAKATHSTRRRIEATSDVVS